MSLYRRIASNFALLFSSGVIVAVLNVGTLSLTARGLGPEGFGALVIIQAFVNLVSRLLAFETWQPVLRMGAGPLASGGEGLAVISMSGVMMDMTASIAAGVIGFAIAYYGSALVPIDESNKYALYIYCLTLFFGVGGTPKGVFRLFDRFDLLVRYQVVQAFLLLAGSFVLFLNNSFLWEYVCVFSAITIGYNIFLLIHMFMFLVRRVPNWNVLAMAKDWLTVRKFFRMAVGTSALSSLVDTRRSIETFFVGNLCGETGVGIYSAMSRITTMIPRLVQPLRQVVFPEVAKLANAGDRAGLRKLTLRISSFLGALAIVVAVAGFSVGDMLVEAFFGSEYGGHEWVFFFLLCSVLASIAAIHLNPLIQVLRGVRGLIAVAFISYLIFLVLVIPLARIEGIEGAAVASLISESAALIMLVAISYKLIQHSKREDCADNAPNN